jgi:hypothetical protein
VLVSKATIFYPQVPPLSSKPATFLPLFSGNFHNFGKLDALTVCAPHGKIKALKNAGVAKW